MYHRTAHSPRVAPPVAFVAAPSTLHAQTSLQSCETVGRDTVDFAVASTSHVAAPTVDAELFTIGVFARQIEQIDTSEDGEKSAEKGDSIACVDSVEALEEKERSDEGECRECDIV